MIDIKKYENLRPDVLKHQKVKSAVKNEIRIQEMYSCGYM